MANNETLCLFLLGFWKQSFPRSNLPAQDARNWFLGPANSTWLLHPRACGHYRSWSGVPVVWGSRAQLQTSKHSHPRLPTGLFIDLPHLTQKTWVAVVASAHLSHLYSVGVHLPLVLEEQRSSPEDPHGGYKESFPLSFREQHQEKTKTLCWLQTHR